MDEATGEILFEKNADEMIPPASLTKLMTIHLALQAVDAGEASLKGIVPLPPESWAVNQPPRSSLMWLGEGQKLSLNELLLGLAIYSGNDAAVALALYFAPSVEAFAEMMNEEARRLGLARTFFVEPSGVSEDNMTTAEDFTKFCRFYIRQHPEALEKYHSLAAWSYRSSQEHKNHNTLLGVYPGIDGLKTGYIDESGYNIALTALRDNDASGLGSRFIAVLLGAETVPLRDADGRALLDWAFGNYHTVRALVKKPEAAPLWKGKASAINFAPLKDANTIESDESYLFIWTEEKTKGNNLRYRYEPIDPVIAPVEKGQELGSLVLYEGSGTEMQVFKRIPLFASEDAAEGNIFKRLWDSLRLTFR
jgi:D-alanyl-D-alanine carboxypeptidase (penicillin-binding protein 5/6)